MKSLEFPHEVTMSLYISKTDVIDNFSTNVIFLYLKAQILLDLLI